MPSTREEWEEACRWVYQSNNYNREPQDDELFVPFIDGDRLKYYFLSTPNKITNWLDINDYSVTIITQYKQYKLVEPFCGPVQPPPSPVIKKIRASYTRQRNHYGIAI